MSINCSKQFKHLIDDFKYTQELDILPIPIIFLSRKLENCDT